LSWPGGVKTQGVLNRSGDLPGSCLRRNAEIRMYQIKIYIMFLSTDKHFVNRLDLLW
jgi:hypothetical protein